MAKSFNGRKMSHGKNKLGTRPLCPMSKCNNHMRMVQGRLRCTTTAMTQNGSSMRIVHGSYTTIKKRLKREKKC